MIITEEGIKAVFLRHTRCPGIAQAPLAESTSRVALGFEHFSDGHIIFTQCQTAAICADRCMARMLTCHQRTARRRTDIASRKHLSKPQAFRHHLVDIGRLENGMIHG